ncbi:MAG TPA: lipopolysaccharide kinase InaA family protein [Gammaproteobacteria bacterium]|nr:lipopolysaccharide kinase InaA family protein [Gammaproteobacteria bacterium]
MPEIKKITINPTCLTDDESKILSQFLQDSLQKGIQIFYPRREYPFVSIVDKNGERTNTTIMLTHAIIHRKKINHKLANNKSEMPWDSYSTDSFTIVSNVARKKEAYGMIAEVACTHHWLTDKNLYTSYQPRIIKVIEHQPPSTKTAEMAEIEANLSGMIYYLHSKQPTVEKKITHCGEKMGQAIRSCFVMRDLDGISLNTLLNSNNKITMDKRIRLAKNFLHCLKEQIHDRGIAHQDLRSENILIDILTWEVKIIDFNLSIKQHEKPDLYSVASILLLLLCGKNIQPVLFKDCYGIKTYHKNNIIALLEKMVVEDPEKQPTLDESIILFEQIELERKLDRIFFKCYRITIASAHQIAMDAYSALRAKITNHPIEKMRDILLTAIDKLDPSSSAIKEFIDIINIKAFYGLKDKNHLKKKLTSILNIFFENAGDTVILRHHAEDYFSELKTILLGIQNSPISSQLENQFQDLFIKIDNRLYKIDSMMHKKDCPATLDEIDEFNSTVYWKKPNLQSLMNSIRAQLIPLTSCNKILKIVVPENKDDNVTRIKNGIRLAIESYIQSTLTWDNFKKQNRAASLRRRNNMMEILTILENTNDETTLLKMIKHKTYQINGFFGRSLLCRNIREAISLHPVKISESNHPVN